MFIIILTGSLGKESNLPNKLKLNTVLRSLSYIFMFSPEISTSLAFCFARIMTNFDSLDKKARRRY